LLKQWTDPSFVLVPEEAKFPDLDAYVAEHYPNGRPYHLGGPWDGKAELKLEEGLTGNRVLHGSGWGFGVDAERKVEAMEFRGDAIEKLFGAGDMSAEEFATSFAKAYRVPLKPTAEVADPDIAVLTGNILKTGWSFVNRDAGWAVAISDAKVLQIQSITPASRQAFD
jgi:predicted NBD/HSP70 family sugar kinase